jgi:methylglutaconyl-CoA hydratase
MKTVLSQFGESYITTLTLNRPERRNALTVELMTELCDAIDSAEADPTQRILILRGMGPAFCAGLDLQETMEIELAHRSAEMVARTLLKVSQTRLMTIAVVHGAAVAGGAGLMSACDFVIATEGAEIGYPEVRRGLVAGLVMTFLRRQVKERDIRELLLRGELVPAARAREMGLVNQVVAESSLEEELQRLCADLLLGGPSAQVSTKRLLNEMWFADVEADLQRALKHHMAARTSVEATQRIAAFLEKRKT